jgi:phosphatidylethanolamine-binding protein (PEBP) family uncharacterized protein
MQPYGRAVLVAAALGAVLSAQTAPATIVVSSPVLKGDQPIPRDYTADGRNWSPPLGWSGVPAGTQIAGAIQGLSGFRRPFYRGPAPPPGKPHHYHFVVYALDGVELKPGLTRAELLDAMKAHVLGQGELVATYERKPA